MAKQRKTVNHLYECDDCHARRYVKPYELTRAAKPRCWNCGNTRLEPVADGTREELMLVRAIKTAWNARLRVQPQHVLE